jgi:hypothetical protein
MGELATKGFETDKWTGGHPKATWYDKHGRSFVLPADPYSIEHYQDRGLRLAPPESLVPLVEDAYSLASRGEGPIPGAAYVEPEPKEEMFGGLPFIEPRKGRGPDKKPRKKRKKHRKRA